MDELKTKLLSRRPGELVQGADKLLKNIYQKLSDGSKENEELALLWDLIGSSEVECAQTCSYLLVRLVRNQYIPAQPAITQLLSRISHGMSYDGIVPAVGELLAYLVQKSVESTGAYTCPYGISSNQHPFVSLLRSTPATWDLVLDQCLSLLNHPVASVKSNSLILLKPVLLYLFCDPNYYIHFAPMRTVLFNHIQKSSEDSEEYFDMLTSLVSWMPLNNRTSFSEFCQFTLNYFNFLVENKKSNVLKDQLILASSLMYHQVKFGLDSSATLVFLKSFVDKEDVVACWDVHVVVFKNILDLAPLGAQEPLLQFCIELFNKNKISKLVAGLMVCASLQSLSFDSNVSSSTGKKAEFIRLCLAKNWEEAKRVPAGIRPQKHFDDQVNRAIEFVRTADIVTASLELRLNWLRKLVSVDQCALSQFLPLFSSIFIFASTSEEAKLTLQLMLLCVKESPENSSTVLTLLLHKLATTSNSTSDPEIKLDLLHALPSMAADKGCVSLILKLLGSFTSKPLLTPLRLTLLLKLWRLEPRVFQFLHKALEETPDETVFTQVQIARAMVIKDIVSTHAGQYGSDLLPIISSILNQCSKPQVTTAATLALQSIYTLCKESIIDIRTTIKVIAPKCSRDTRPRVLEEYCRIFSLIPTFRVSGVEYAKFVDESISWLWKTVATSEINSVVAAAYRAIASYPLEATKLKMLPQYAREGVKLPSEYCATPADAARRPEDVLPYVPSDCWVKLLRPAPGAAFNTPILEGKLEVLKALMKTEVENLPRAIYHPSGGMQSSGAEPVNYNHLPAHSLLRGIIAHLIQSKDQPNHPSSHNQESEVVSQTCLQILSQDYGRPLPPFDWLMLESFLDRPLLKPGFIATISLLAPHSRSSKIIAERQVGATELDRATESLYMNNLYYLCCAIPPPTIASFTSRAIQRALKRALSDDAESDDFKLYLKNFKDAFSKTGIPEGNLITLANSLEGIYDAVPTDVDGYEDYIDTLAVLPNKNIERLSSPALWWEVTPLKVERAAGLRTKLALSEDTETPLTWLNEMLEVAGKQSGDYTFLLRNLVSVLVSARNKSSQSVLGWLLELMGQVSGILRKPDGQQSAAFLVDVFILAVVVFTGTETICIPRDQLCMSRSVRQSLLPAALCRLCLTAPGLSGQLADWCLRLSKKNLPNNLSDCMTNCLSVFKFAENWKEAFMWGRIVIN